MATLFQIGNDGSRIGRWEIGEDPLIVGRSGQARANVADEGISRRHFLILREGDEYVIKDLNSRNGTWLEGRRVSAEKLHHDDCIFAGHTLFLFADQVAPPATLSQPQTGPHGTVMLSPLRSALP